MIDSVRDYISECPYLDEITPVNVDYLTNDVKAYSVNEGISYDPVINKDILKNEYSQFQFTFDAKLYWNDEENNNIDNSKFLEDFSNWLRENNRKKIFPVIDDENIVIESIGTISSGYIQDTNANEAIYRISCVMYYTRYINIKEEEI